MPMRSSLPVGSSESWKESSMSMAGVGSISGAAVRAAFDLTGSRPAVRSRRDAHMGGHSTITLVGGSASLLDAAFALAHRCEALWSRFLPSSEISRLNWAEGIPIKVNPLTVRLIESMRHGFALTNGDFDPTLLPSLLAAGYSTSVVDSTKVTTLPDSARAPGDLVGITIAGDLVMLPVGTTLDPGGIGKGLAADLVCEFAMAEGAWGVIAEFGGDVVVAGDAPEQSGWRVAVEDPFLGETTGIFVRLGSGSIATSSQRKRRWHSHGRTSHHLIDPRSDSSAVTDVQTVSVIAGDGRSAEVLTKPGFLRDIDSYLGWLPTVNAAGLVIDGAGTAHESENWQDYS